MSDDVPLKDNRIQLAWPVDKPSITQRFAENPDFYKQYKLPGHDGIDLKAKEGDPVFSAAKGQVSRVGRLENDPFGLQLRIQHESDGVIFETFYGHLSETFVEEGEFVQARQLIAEAGKSGNATGPNLHFGLKVKGLQTPGYPDEVVDPLPYFSSMLEDDTPFAGDATSKVDSATSFSKTKNSIEKDQESLLKQLRDADQEGRREAVRELADVVKDDDAVCQAITNSLEDESKYVRLEAIQALQDLAAYNENVLSGIAKRLDDADDKVRLAAVNVLKEQIANNSILRDRFIEMRDDPNSDVQQAVNEALQPLQATSSEDNKIQTSKTDSTITYISVPSLVEDGAIDTNTTSDEPIQYIEQDKFGFNDYVNALKQFILSDDTQPPLVIGIDGSWGSGKSSLMSMLKNELKNSVVDKKKIADWKANYRNSLLCWTWGKILLWLYRNKTDNDVPHRILYIRYGLAFDPMQHNLENDTKNWSKEERDWANVAKMHKPHLDSTPLTVWFNAWKYSQEEQLWAALALDVLNQIKKLITPWERFTFWVRLTIKRTSILGLAWEIFKRILIPILFIVVYLIYEQYLDSCGKEVNSICNTLEEFARGKNWVLLGGVLVSGYVSVSKILQDPFQINLKAVLDQPDYKTRIGFLGEFEEDFSRIIEIATRPVHGRLPRKLVIFIDDLDRCEPPKAADIVSAINIMLDNARCIFVLGMDIRAVLPSIEKKYKEIFEHIREQDPDIGDPARVFLEKIIQIPLRVPRPTPDKIQDYISELAAKKITELQRAPEINLPTSKTDHKAIDASETIDRDSLKQTPKAKDVNNRNTADIKTRGAKDPSQDRIDPLRYNREQIQQAIERGALYIGDNPRLAKRYVNLFRLFVYLAIQRSVLRWEHESIDVEGESKNDENNQRQLTPNHLAVWLAWSMRWYEVVDCLQDEGQVGNLRKHLMKIALLDPEAKDFEVARIKITQDVLEQRNEPLTSRWCLLNWDLWLRDDDFHNALRDLEQIWTLPERGQEDWLETLLNMSAATRIPVQETESS